LNSIAALPLPREGLNHSEERCEMSLTNARARQTEHEGDRLSDLALRIYQMTVSRRFIDAGGEVVLEALDTVRRGEKLGRAANDIAEYAFTRILRAIIEEATPKSDCPGCGRTQILIPAYGICMACVAEG
jgi:hypothetical protein